MALQTADAGYLPPRGLGRIMAVMAKKSVIFSILMALAGFALLAAYMFAVTPAAIRNPRLDHAHFRLVLIVNGNSVNFAEEKFQKQSQAFCTDELSEDPIHFHDHKDQFVHLHWKGVTGGLVLKNYGWNLIGGKDGLLGYRADRLPLQNRVPIYGNVLPELPADARLWVYAGKPGDYRLRDTNDFLVQDLETFLGRKSNVSAGQSDLLRDLLFTRAAAHEGHDHAAPAEPAHDLPKTQEELSVINNLLGNVVVFAQKDKPRDVQIKDAFDRLEPLTESSCGG